MNKAVLLTSAIICASVTTTAKAGSAAAGVCREVTPSDGSKPPSTAAVVRLVKDWVATINSADDAAYSRFVEERGPVFGEGMDPLLFRDFLRGMQCAGSNPRIATP